MIDRFRHVVRTISAVPASDGAGVRLRRSLGSTQYARLDPFLMLDEFYSDDPDDYLAGFPEHPHRGFQTVTYMLEGHMRHQDHLGNHGDLGPGGAQWMVAGRGIVHSEMPQQSEGRMHGFQLWINLPRREKLQPASYRDLTPEQVAQHRWRGGRARVIAGRLPLVDATVCGPVNGDGATTLDPLFADVDLAPDGVLETRLPPAHAAFAYLYRGAASIGSHSLERASAAILAEGGRLVVRAGSAGARVLLLAAAPVNEPVVQYGPFVMNTRAEIEQALADYRDGRLAG
ncbi:MAG: pirin family protein [Pseudomonadota bacterium]